MMIHNSRKEDFLIMALLLMTFTHEIETETIGEVKLLLCEPSMWAEKRDHEEITLNLLRL